MKRELANLGRLKALQLIENTKTGTGGYCCHCLMEVTMLHNQSDDDTCRLCMMNDHKEWEWRITSTSEYVFSPLAPPDESSRVYRAVMSSYWATLEAGE